MTASAGRARGTNCDAGIGLAQPLAAQRQIACLFARVDASMSAYDKATPNETSKLNPPPLSEPA